MRVTETRECYCKIMLSVRFEILFSLLKVRVPSREETRSGKREKEERKSVALVYLRV